MSRFTVIPQDTFQELQLDAGILLNTFNPANPSVTDTDIITATTGGITVACVPTYSDFGEDVDNCPNNTKELKHLDGWECTITTTALGTSPDAIRLALGAADVTDNSSYALTTDTEIAAGKTYYTRSGTSPNYTYTAVTTPSAQSLSSYYEKTGSGKITPRADLAQTDFSDIWWVGDRADGGMVAVQLKNALSTGGFSLQTTKNGKGQISLTLTGHVSINAQDVVPMVFYSAEGE